MKLEARRREKERNKVFNILAVEPTVRPHDEIIRTGGI